MSLTKNQDYYVYSEAAFTGATTAGVAWSYIAFRPNLFTVDTAANYEITCK